MVAVQNKKQGQQQMDSRAIWQQHEHQQEEGEESERGVDTVA
jgi:hypothetical protein